MNPLPGFRTVEVDRSSSRTSGLTPSFFDAAANGTLPSVSWVVPTLGKSEHPPDSIAHGQEWVTKVVNAVMEGPGGAMAAHGDLRHVGRLGRFLRPRRSRSRIDENGYGIRVPGHHDQPVGSNAA